MPVPAHIEVKKATYVDGYRIAISFSDGKNRIVDFSNFLTQTSKELLAKYKTLSNFKNFKVEEGNLVWGKNWDLIFPVYELYQGKIKN